MRRTRHHISPLGASAPGGPFRVSSLSEIHVPGDADDALVWAIGFESELRTERYTLARLGVVGAFRRIREVIVGLDAYERDDPKHPDYHDTMSEIHDGRCTK